MAARRRSLKYRVIFFILSLITALALYFIAMIIKDYSSGDGSVVAIIVIAVGYAILARYLNKLADYLADKLGG